MLQYVPVVYKAGITSGTTVTSSSVSANVAMPVDATGANPKRIQVVCDKTPGVHIKLVTTGAATATASDLMINQTNVFLDSSGAAFIAYIQETAGAKLNITPVES